MIRWRNHLSNEAVAALCGVEDLLVKGEKTEAAVVWAREAEG